MSQSSVSPDEQRTSTARMLRTIQTLRQRLAEREGRQPVAVVGVGLRLPGGIADLDGFWSALAAGSDLVAPMPEARKGPFAAAWDGLAQRGGFLDEVLDFDAAFFGISPREARAVDPQHRLLLEVCWEALEDAGLPPDRLGDQRAGLYLGVSAQDYQDWLPSEPDPYWATGNGHCFAAGRVAYSLGLTGPALAVDTACSSSLVATHLAVQALRRGECAVALAGGVNLVMSPRSTRLVQQTRSLAPDGRCKAFDARANGFARGEGCVTVVLKRLDVALRDRDRVHAVIRGCAVNQDGRSSGFTAPNMLSQVALLEAALADAGLRPADIGYVEAHGTGTALGDPIEVEALATALGRRNDGAALLLGSVKTNIGHLEAAAGAAGLVKALLCLRRRQVPPVVHLQTLNPMIDLSGTAMVVPTELTGWSGGPYAGVSSFGMSGTNAHVILGEPEPAARPAPAPVTGFVISAKTPEALRALADRYARRLAELDPADYPAFAYTAGAGRARHAVRTAVTAADPRSAAAVLAAIAAGTAPLDGSDSGPDDPLPRRVINLPAYPWQRRRYAPERPDAEPLGAVPDRYELHWTAAGPAEPDLSRALVLAGDDEEILALLARAAAERGVLVTVTERPASAGAGPVVLAMKPSPLPDGGPAEPYHRGAGLCATVTGALAGLRGSGGTLFVLTRAARRVEPTDRVAATDHGLLQGLAPVLGLEFGTAWGGVVDLPARPDPADADALVAYAAGRPATPVEDLAAVRAGRLLVARLRLVHQPPAPLPIRDDGTYIVTGGLGAVGREVAADLIRRGARHLLLIGRRPADALDATAQALLAELSGAAAEVCYRGGGCDTPDALAAALAPLDGMPPVRGLVHAAGTASRLAAAELTEDDFAAAMGGKCTAAWWLHRASLGWPLEFFILFSSVTALWGSEGYAGYAAANGALDALAAHRTSLGLPAVSIAYGPWAVDGMADAAARDIGVRMGVRSLDPAAGCAALTCRAPGESAYLIVCRLETARFRHVMAGIRARALLAGAVTQGALLPAEPSVVAELAALPERARAGAARAHVARILASQLGHVDPGAAREDVGFFDLGLDSIMAVDLAARLSQAFAVQVQVADVFDHPTVAALTRYLLGRPAASAPPALAPPALAPAPLAAAPAVTASPATPPQPAGVTGAGEPIAIVGMAGRFPGADSVEELWSLLIEGRDAIGAVPADRWDPRAYGSSFDQGGFLSDIARFDAAFFDIPVREAENVDPQHRLLLESAWHALEDGGIDPKGLKDSRTGVFVGISNSDYGRILARGGPTEVDAYYGAGTALNAGAGRIAYVLGLLGPAMAVDTACSSSLVALHLAVRSLRTGETDLVLAGGVNVMADPLATIAVSKAHMLSPTGRCRTFSADADGYVRAEACAVLVLKRLSDARRAGDRIHAVVRGSAVNSDGASSGLTVPSGTAQEAVLRAALADAGVAGSELEFLEAHGTGTALGDPIELGAAWRVLGPGRAGPLRVGSVKSNLGHCESAAGVVAVVKTVLAMRHDIIPPNLHHGLPNPLVPWAEMDVRVVDAPNPWPRDGRARVAGVSGFGFTGTNAHVVLTDGDPVPPAGDPEPAPGGGPYLVPLSAPGADGLDRLTAAWERRLADATAADLPALAATAGVGRAHFRHRRAMLGRDRDQLLASLRESAAAPVARPPRIAFLFSGQGSQYFGMGRELYETEPVFREVFDECDRLVAPILGTSLTEPVFHGADRDAIGETRVTQPALVALQTALAALWESWGVTAAAVLGHSVGEIAAAMCAGVLDRPSGLTLIATRARLMQGTERGAMLTVAGGEADVAGWLSGRPLDIAALNGPDATVVSGRPAEIEDFAAALRERGVRSQRLTVSHAFHSRLLDQALGELATALTPLTFHPPALPIVSNLTGRLAAPGEYDADYWCRHARQPVRFAACVRELAALDVDACLEIGPDRTLVNLVRANGAAPAGGLLSSLRRGTSERAALLASARDLYRLGQDLDWSRVHAGYGGRRGEPPRYPFAETRYWTRLPAAATAGAVTPAAPAGPAWGTELRSPALRGRVFASVRSPDYPPHLTDHRLFGTVSVSGASQTATVLSALAPDGLPIELVDLHFPRTLVLKAGERYDLQVIEAEQEHGARTVSVQSLLDAGQWQEHLSARLVPARQAALEGAGDGQVDVQAFIAAAERHVTGEAYYHHVSRLGYGLGPSFQWIDEVWIRGDEALVRYVEPAGMNEDPDGYEIHPGLLDSLFQSTATFEVGPDEAEPGELTGLVVPFVAARLAFPGRPRRGGELWGYVRAVRYRRQPDGRLQVESADLRMLDGAGATVLAVDDFRGRRAPRSLLERSLRAAAPNAYELGWVEWKPYQPGHRPRQRRLVVADAGDPIGAALCAAFEVPVTVKGAAEAELIVDGRFAVAQESLAAAVSLAQGLRTAPRQVPYAVLCPADDAAAPVREALWGLLAALESEEPDRRLLRVTLAAGWDPMTVAGALDRALEDGIPESRLEVGARKVRVARLLPYRRPAKSASAGRGGAALISGGLGALGLSVARALARRGVPAITLMARSAPDASARGVIAELAAAGTRVRVVRGDVTDPAACREAVAVAGRDVPLRTIVHLAGTTADATFEQQDRRSFEAVYAAKAGGAVQLAAATCGQDLDAFVLFSSAAAVLGAAGQTNYAAVNGFLDGLARSLRAAGVPAVSVNWGPWVTEVKGGLAAAEGAQRALRRSGQRPLTDDEAAELLAVVLEDQPTQLVALALDAQRYVGALSGHRRAALLQAVVAAARRPARGPDRSRGWLYDELVSLSREARVDRVAASVRETAGDVLGDRAAIDDETGFAELGLDSIMVIDLRSRLAHALAVDLPATLAIDYPTVMQVAAHVVDVMFPAAPADPIPDGDLGGLSFEELIRAVQLDVSADT